MEQYKTVIICMDDTRRDEPMLSYMTPLLHMTGTESTFLLHVHDPDSDPHTISMIPSNECAVQIPVTPLSDFTEKTRDNMVELANRYLCNLPGMNYRVILSSAPETTEILDQAATLDADLIVIGRHYGDHMFNSGRAVMARRITQKSTCTVLILPENAPAQISKIVVPVRNSKCSSVALETACGLASACGAEVTALNIYRTESKRKIGTGTIDPRSAENRRQAAITENQKLFSRTQLSTIDIINECAPSSAQGPVKTILETITQHGSNLVVIGARGRTGAAGVLLGAITEELILNSPVPVLAVKRKGECLNVLHALLSLLKR